MEKQKKNVSKIVLLMIGMFGIIPFTHASLNPVGSGLVNDTVQNIIWLQDANMFKTLCDANAPIYSGWTGEVDDYKKDICSNNGQMTWNDAEAWIVRLNEQNYLGFSNWRQPLTPQPDASCEIQVSDPSPQSLGYNCTGSELGHLFNVATPAGLGNSNDADAGCAPNCFTNTGPFNNTQNSQYWSGRSSVPNPAFAWLFITSFGFQDRYPKDNSPSYVWPVLSEQFAVAPPIQPQPVPALSIWGLGLMIMLIGYVGRRRIR